MRFVRECREHVSDFFAELIKAAELQALVRN